MARRVSEFMDSGWKVFVDNKPATAAYATGFLLLMCGQLEITWWVHDAVASEWAWWETLLMNIAIPLILSGMMFLLGSLYLWMRPITPKSFAKRVAGIVATSLGLGVILGIFLGTIAMIAFSNVSEGSMFGKGLIDILGIIISIPASTYLVCFIANVIAADRFNYQIPYRLFLATLPIMTGSVILHAALDYLPHHLFFVIARAVIVSITATAVFVFAITRAEVESKPKGEVELYNPTQ